jgi:hypothetical protein
MTLLRKAIRCEAVKSVLMKTGDDNHNPARDLADEEVTQRGGDSLMKKGTVREKKVLTAPEEGSAL